MTIATKPVTRETAVLYRRRPLIITVTPRTLVLREKGRRDRLEISFDVIYELALKRRFERERREKRK